jgi:hypothetical protein
MYDDLAPGLRGGRADVTTVVDGKVLLRDHKVLSVDAKRSTEADAIAARIRAEVIDKASPLPNPLALSQCRSAHHTPSRTSLSPITRLTPSGFMRTPKRPKWSIVAR